MLQGRTYQTRCQQLKLPALKVCYSKKRSLHVCAFVRDQGKATGVMALQWMSLKIRSEQ